MSQLHLQLKFAPKKSLLVLLVLVALLLAGCVADTGQMADQPRYDLLEPSQLLPNGQSAQPLPVGVVPFAQNIDQSVFSQSDGERVSPNAAALTGVDESGSPVSGFPVAVDLELVKLGQERFNIYCIPCHGPAGEANGIAVQFGVLKPPSLLDTNARTITSGDIFKIITEGRGKMFPYDYRVQPNERWAIISYIRALQLKSGPADPASLTPEDLKAIEGQP